MPFNLYNRTHLAADLVKQKIKLDMNIEALNLEL